MSNLAEGLSNESGKTETGSQGQTQGTETNSSQAESNAAKGDGNTGNNANGSPENNVTVEWNYDENIKGSGERPEWLKPKYKSVADQAKAYAEAEKRLGAFKGAPEKYDLTLEGSDIVLDPETDPVLKEFLEDAKKNNVSQEYVSKLIVTYAQALTRFMPNLSEEMSKLGANATRDIGELVNWGAKNLSKDDLDTYKDMMTSAKNVRLLEKLRDLALQENVAEPQGNSVHHETEEQVRQLVHDPRFETDPIFRKDVESRMARARKSS